jgi:hypothetical protein
MYLIWGLLAHCDEEMTSFEQLCGLLSPDLPLLTMIRGTMISLL